MLKRVKMKIFTSNWKSFLIMLVGIGFVFYGKAQVLLQEDFESAVIPAPPTGWITSNTGSPAWESLEGPNAYQGEKSMYLAGAYGNVPSDAWLISPAVNLEAGKKYSISFYYKNQQSLKNQMQVTLGDNADAGSQTEIIWDNKFDNVSYVKGQINYTATETGTKYIGFHVITPSTQTYLYLDMVTVEEVGVFAPLSVKITASDTTSVTVKWDEVDSAKNYEYGVSTSADTPPTTINTVKRPGAIVSDLNPATQYYFYVRAKAYNDSVSNWTIEPFATSYTVADIPQIECGIVVNNDFLTTRGIYNTDMYCSGYGSGREFFHKFTPTSSGNYFLDVTGMNTGLRVTFLYKDASLGAGPKDWICIGQSNFTGKFSFGPLEAGKTYLIMEKVMVAPGFPGFFGFGIECPAAAPSYDSCGNPLSIEVMPYSDDCVGTHMTTQGATKDDLKDNPKVCGAFTGANDDDVWFTFTATSSVQQFRFNNVTYTSLLEGANPGLYINIYENKCDPKSVIDCGYIWAELGQPINIYSYLLDSGKTYYCQIFTADQFSRVDFDLCVSMLGITPGMANTCLSGLPLDVSKASKTDAVWLPFTDANYKMIGQLDAQKQDLGNVAPFVFVNTGNLRKDGKGTYYLDRNFTFKPDVQPGRNMNVRLYFTNEELDRLIAQPGSQVTSVYDLVVTANLDDCAAQFMDSALQLLKPTAAGDYDEDHKYVEFSTRVLGSFYLHGGNKVLPVQLTSFTGSVQGNNVLLNWKTATEVNVKNFRVERSLDGQNFSTLGNVTASGNSNVEQSYSYLDSKVPAAVWFYRLAMIDNDGQVSYSDNIRLNVNGIGEITVSPNPFRNQLIISTNEAANTKYTISISNMVGKTVRSLKATVDAGMNKITLSTTDLASGLYILKIEKTDGTVIHHKLVKE